MTFHFELSYTADDGLENVLVCAVSTGGFTEEGGRKVGVIPPSNMWGTSDLG